MLYKELRKFLFYFVWVYRLNVSSFRRKLRIQIICYVTFYTLHYCFFLWLCSPARPMASWFTRFLDHTQRRATVGRTVLDE
jgi:hypothetical protein